MSEEIFQLKSNGMQNLYKTTLVSVLKWLQGHEV